MVLQISESQLLLVNVARNCRYMPHQVSKDSEYFLDPYGLSPGYLQNYEG